MSRKISFLLLIAIGAFFWHCSETRELGPEEVGTNYFPLKTGMYRIYQVNGITYNFSEDSVVFSYLLKESVIDSFQNLEEGISYTIQRQKKTNESDPWATDSIWTARKDAGTAVMVENNVPIVNLTFPFLENKTWDGNKLNHRDADEFEMVNIKKPYADPFGSYEHTVTVIQEDLPDLIVNTISKKEIYAEGKGLVYKENIILKYKTENQYLSLEIIDTGLKYFQYLVEYGEE